MASPAMTPLNAKVKPEEKELFLQTCDSIGTTPSNAIRMFVSAFNKRGGFPFDSRNPNLSSGVNSQTQVELSKSNREETLSAIETVCSDFPAINQAFIFGSMARNTFTDQSDIDIRLVLDRAKRFNLRDLSQFVKRIQQLTNREVDVVSSDKVADKELAAAIERDKVLAYERIE